MSRHFQGSSCAHCGAHAETPEEENARAEQSLFSLINVERSRVLNARDAKKLAAVLRPYDRRAERSEFIESDEDDNQLLVFVQFSGCVKIKSITVTGESNESSPKNLKCWINRDDIDFSNVNDSTALQEFELVEESSCQSDIEYKTKQHKFQRVENITLLFDENFGDANSTRICYIGFRGEFDQKISREPVIAVYESRPMVEDHKVTADKNTPKYQQ